MAAPTIAAQGRNREMHCATASYTFSSTAASTYTSDVIIPAGAQVLSVGLRAGATAPGSGTSIQVLVGGVARSTVVNRSSNFDAVGENYTEVAALHTDATSDNGALAILTAGTFGDGIVEVTVCYVV